ncbi:hypothetical protein BC941DRAFT_497951 [Chlamydoabsidia padenii]|nr:hypothetical protein BC941DRAFT_497951 [Chlamydoabsidia padenii]
MKFTSALMTLVAITTMVNANPIQKRDTPYQITSPTANTTVQVNQNLSVTWNKGTDNSPIDISLIAGSDQPLSESSIAISKGISGSIGTVVYLVPSSLNNGTWRVAISHGSDIEYSPAFHISSTTQQQVQQPSFSASASNASYSAVASIAVVGPDGKPVTPGGSNGASSLGVFMMTYLLVPLAGYMLM